MHCAFIRANNVVSKKASDISKCNISLLKVKIESDQFSSNRDRYCNKLLEYFTEL